MADETVSSQVYKSRDQIRNQIITLLKQYLELENVDLTKSSFLSFIVDSLSTLTSNTLFYQISAFSHTLEEFDTREEAEDFMIESAGNDVTTEYGNEIVEDDIEYMSLLENALSYYSVEEWIGC